MVQPTALPRLTAMRSGSTAAGARPLSATASRAETTANCAARSIRRIRRGVSPAAAGSKSTSAATCERNAAGSNRVIRRVAVRPSDNVRQKAYGRPRPARPRRCR
ncbi:hypothetical protein SHIRM173S_05809 [Streptomyces hirsutus]